MTFFATRATETWSFGTVIGGLVLLVAAILVILWAVRVTDDRYDR